MDRKDRNELLWGYVSHFLLGILAVIGGTSNASAQVSNSITFTDQAILTPHPQQPSAVATAVVDMNQDGLDDIVRFRSPFGPPLPQIEYQQIDGAEFLLRALPSQIFLSSGGIAIGDADDNGMPDIVAGRTLDYLRADNRGEFYRAFKPAGVSQTNPGSLHSTNFVDINMDGRLDVFATNIATTNPKLFNSPGGRLSLANSIMDTDVQGEPFDRGPEGSVWIDYDNDGDLDLYVSRHQLSQANPQDVFSRNQLFENDGTGNYTDVAAAAGLASTADTRSTDFGDIDNDGDLDCFIGNFSDPSMLMLNNGDGTFSDISATAGVNINWDVVHVAFRDFNCDGWADLLVAGDQHGLWINDRDGTFSSVANPFSGGSITTFALGDLNHDGFPDVHASYALANLPLNTQNIPDGVFFSTPNGNGFLAVTLLGRESNRLANGARVELHGPWGVQIREVRGGRDSVTHSFTQRFGMGDTPVADKLVVRWPSGFVDTVLNVEADQFLVLEEGDSLAPVIFPLTTQNSALGDPVQLEIPAADPTGNAFTFGATNLPPGLSIDPHTGIISGVTGVEGTFITAVTVADAWSSFTKTFTWVVGTGGGGGDGPIASYEFAGNAQDSSINSLHLLVQGSVQFVDGVARFDALGDNMGVFIPDSLILPEEGVAFTLEARILPRAWLAWAVDNAPVIALVQEWNSNVSLEDQKWGSNPKGPTVQSSGGVLATAAQVASGLTIGQWNDFRIEYDGQSTVSVFINDLLVSAANLPPDAGRTNDWRLILGNFDGDIDDVRLFDPAATGGGGGPVSQVFPSVAISTAVTQVTEPFQVTVVFDEDVTGFDQGDIAVTNASISNFSGSGTSYQFTLSPIATGQLKEGAVTVSIPAGVANSSAGSANLGSNSLRVDYRILPGIDEYVPDANTIALYHMNGDFTDASSNGLDLVVTGAAQSLRGTAHFNALGDQLTVTIPDNLVQPNGGQPLTIEARILQREWLAYGVNDVPVVSLRQEWDSGIALEDTKWGTDPKGPNVVSANGVVADNVQWANASVPGEWQTLRIWFDGTATVYCSIDGVVINSAPLAPNSSRDGDWTLTLGNFRGELDEVHISSTILGPGNDIETPVPVLSTPSSPVSGEFTVTATFDQNVIGVLATDFIVTSGFIGRVTGSGNTYTAKVKPFGQGPVTVQFAADRVTDQAGNLNAASNLLSVDYNQTGDTQPPNVVLSTAQLTVNAPFLVNALFDEDVRYLLSSEVVVTNGTFPNPIETIGSSFDYLVTPTAAGEVTISIPAGVVADYAGNLNTASNLLTVVFDDSPPAGGIENTADANTVALYHLNADYEDSSTNGLHLTTAGGVQLVSDNLLWMGNPAGKVARFSSIGETLTVNIPDSLVLPDDGSNQPITLEAWIYPRAWLGYGLDDLPIVALSQEWDTNFELQDSRWGSNPKGPRIVNAGVPLATSAQWAAAAPIDTWALLQIGFDGNGTVSAWINGQATGAVATSPNLGRSNDWTLTLGNFSGDIDEVFIHHGLPTGAPAAGNSTGAAAAVIAEEMNDSGLDPASTTALADPDGDGYCNQIEVALGSDPLTAETPSIELALDSSGGTEIAFPVPELAQLTANGWETVAFEYIVEVSENLVDWAPTETTLIESIPLEQGFKRVTQRIGSTDPVVTFVRLTVIAR